MGKEEITIYDDIPLGYEIQFASLKEALSLIVEPVYKEQEEEFLYEYLIDNAPNEDEKNIIKSIRDDERKHKNMIRKFYKFFTDKDIPESENVNFKKPQSYIDGVKIAALKKHKSIEQHIKLYKLIIQSLSNQNFINMAFEILQEEQKHAIEYNFILSMH
ncbi:ferritin-like domain-containing protein [Haloimpatiens sp. FM7330]|uniref:ferritin-like domain-containing protein n=1 Tax=Haloimpatiens sp. FM7330 TaxID=3298610 RepID=UPI0036454CD3